jgi:transposase-like protein
MNKKEITPADKLTFPSCLSHIKKNGHNHYGKHNYQCLKYGRQFAIRNETVSAQNKEIIKSLLLERISLGGICRFLGIS